MQNTPDDPTPRPAFCPTCERPTIMQRIRAVYDAARTIAPHPGELTVRVPPTCHGVKVSIAVGTVLAHTNAENLEAALDELRAKLEDIAEQQAVRDEHKGTAFALRAPGEGKR